MDLSVDLISLGLGAVSTALMAFVTWFVHRLTAKLEKAEEAHKAEEAANKARVEALERGSRASMRTMLIDAHERYVLRGDPLTYDVLHHLEDVYESYHGLGGNGSGTLLWEAIQAKAKEV